MAKSLSELKPKPVIVEPPKPAAAPPTAPLPEPAVSTEIETTEAPKPKKPAAAVPAAAPAAAKTPAPAAVPAAAKTPAPAEVPSVVPVTPIRSTDILRATGGTHLVTPTTAPGESTTKPAGALQGADYADPMQYFADQVGMPLPEVQSRVADFSRDPRSKGLSEDAWQREVVKYVVRDHPQYNEIVGESEQEPSPPPLPTYGFSQGDGHVLWAALRTEWEKDHYAQAGKRPVGGGKAPEQVFSDFAAARGITVDELRASAAAAGADLEKIRETAQQNRSRADSLADFNRLQLGGRYSTPEKARQAAVAEAPTPAATEDDSYSLVVRQSPTTDLVTDTPEEDLEVTHTTAGKAHAQAVVDRIDPERLVRFQSGFSRYAQDSSRIFAEAAADILRKHGVIFDVIGPDGEKHKIRMFADNALAAKGAMKDAGIDFGAQQDAMATKVANEAFRRATARAINEAAAAYTLGYFANPIRARISFSQLAGLARPGAFDPMKDDSPLFTIGAPIVDARARVERGEYVDAAAQAFAPITQIVGFAEIPGRTNHWPVLIREAAAIETAGDWTDTPYAALRAHFQPAIDAMEAGDRAGAAKQLALNLVSFGYAKLDKDGNIVARSPEEIYADTLASIEQRQTAFEDVSQSELLETALKKVMFWSWAAQKAGVAPPDRYNLDYNGDGKIDAEDEKAGWREAEDDVVFGIQNLMAFGAAVVTLDALDAMAAIHASRLMQAAIRATEFKPRAITLLDDTAKALEAGRFDEAGSLERKIEYRPGHSGEPQGAAVAAPEGNAPELGQVSRITETTLAHEAKVLGKADEMFDEAVEGALPDIPNVVTSPTGDVPRRFYLHGSVRTKNAPVITTEDLRARYDFKHRYNVVEALERAVADGTDTYAARLLPAFRKSIDELVLTLKSNGIPDVQAERLGKMWEKAVARGEDISTMTETALEAFLGSRNLDETPAVGSRVTLTLPDGREVGGRIEKINADGSRARVVHDGWDEGTATVRGGGGVDVETRLVAQPSGDSIVVNLKTGLTESNVTADGLNETGAAKVRVLPRDGAAATPQNLETAKKASRELGARLKAEHAVAKAEGRIAVERARRAVDQQVKVRIAALRKTAEFARGGDASMFGRWMQEKMPAVRNWFARFRKPKDLIELVDSETLRLAAAVDNVVPIDMKAAVKSLDSAERSVAKQRLALEAAQVAGDEAVEKKVARLLKAAVTKRDRLVREIAASINGRGHVLSDAGVEHFLRTRAADAGQTAADEIMLTAVLLDVRAEKMIEEGVVKTLEEAHARFSWRRSDTVEPDALLQDETPDFIEPERLSRFRQTDDLADAKAYVQFEADGKALVTLMKKADASSFLHESAHIFRRTLDEKDNATILRWTKAAGLDVELQNGLFVGKDAIKAEKMFARAFERFVMEGKTSVKGLRRLFENLRNVMLRIYYGSKALNTEISPEIEILFNRMLAPKSVATDATPTIHAAVPKTSASKWLATQSKGLLKAEDILPALEAGDTVRLPFRVFGKDEINLDDFLRLQLQLDEIAASPNPAFKLPFSEVRQQVVEDTLVGDIQSATSGPVPHDVTAIPFVISKVLATIPFGADAFQKMRVFAPRFREMAQSAGRLLNQRVGDMNVFLREARAEDQYLPIIRYMTGERQAFRVGGRQPLSAGHDAVREIGIILEDSHKALKNSVVKVSESIDPQYKAAGGVAHYVDANGEVAETVAGAAKVGEMEVELAVLARLVTDQPTPALRSRAVNEQLGSRKNQNIVRAVVTAMMTTGGTDDASNTVFRHLGMALLNNGVMEGVPVSNVVRTAEVPHMLAYVDALHRLGGFDVVDNVLVPNNRTSAERLQDFIDVLDRAGFGPEGINRALVVVNAFGAQRSLYTHISGLGAAFTKEQVQSFHRFLTGDVRDARDYADGLRLFKQFGLNREALEEAAGLLEESSGRYIPASVQRSIDSALSRALDETADKGSTDMAHTAAKWILQVWQRSVVRGNFVPKAAKAWMDVMDTFFMVSAEAGFKAGARAAGRQALQSAFIAFQGHLLGRLTHLGASRTDKIRSALQNFSDWMMSPTGQKTVNKVLQGSDELYRTADGRVYRYSDILKVAIRNGTVSSFESSDLRESIRRAQEASKVAGGNVVRRAANDVGRSVRNAGTTVLHANSEIFEAWAERERVGAKMTLIEAGMNPEEASKAITRALFDYPGSLAAAETKGTWSGVLLTTAQPFWAFSKNINHYMFNAIDRPEVMYRLTRIRRAVEYGQEAVSQTIYSFYVDPYGFDVAEMAPETRASYYHLRYAYEESLGKMPHEMTEEERLTFAAALMSGSPDDMMQVANGQTFRLPEGEAASLARKVSRLEGGVDIAASYRPEPRRDLLTDYQRKKITAFFPAKRTGMIDGYIRSTQQQDLQYAVAFFEPAPIAGMTFLANTLALYAYPPALLSENQRASTAQTSRALEYLIDPERMPLKSQVAAFMQTGQPQQVSPPLAWAIQKSGFGAWIYPVSEPINAPSRDFDLAAGMAEDIAGRTKPMRWYAIDPNLNIALQVGLYDINQLGMKATSGGGAFDRDQKWDILRRIVGVLGPASVTETSQRAAAKKAMYEIPPEAKPR